VHRDKCLTASTGHPLSVSTRDEGALSESDEGEKPLGRNRTRTLDPNSSETVDGLCEANGECLDLNSHARACLVLVRTAGFWTAHTDYPARRELCM
jgi:hypothetical protein